MYNKKLLRNKKMAGAALCAVLMAAMTLTSCGTTSAANTTANEEAAAAENNTITYEAAQFTGQITSVEDNTVTLLVSSESNMEIQGMGAGGSVPEMPSGAGNGMSGSGDGNGMGGSGDGSAPEMPSGDGNGTGGSGDGSAPEMPSGDGNGMSGSGEGSVPEMPSGDGNGTGGSGDGSAPEKPSGDGNGTGGSGDGSAPEKPSDDAAGNDSAGSQTAENSADASAGTEEGTESQDAFDPGNPEDSTEAEEDVQEETDGITVILTLNDTSVLTDENGESVEISNLEEDEYLKVSLDSDGNIESVVLTENTGMSMGSTGAGGSDMGSAPDGNMGGADMGSAPDGNMGGTDMGSAPDGNMGGADMGSAPGGNMGGSDMGSAPGGNMGGGMGGQSSGVDSYTAVTEYQEDTSEDGQTYTSTGTDENAIYVDNGASVTISNAAVTRDSEDSTGGDNSSFYGVGAAVLTTDGNVYVSDSTIETDANGGAGVFAYGDGIAYVSGTNITTQKGTSGGLHVAGGGTLYAWDDTVETNGESSAAIRSDRGGGTMVIDGGSYTSNGTGSPAIYCTADIAVNNAELTANGSEAVCIEGLNSIHLYNSSLTGNMPENDQNDCDWNVIVYQSMSGDSEVGNGTFSMIGGTLTAKNGGMFYTTNTDSTFYLSGVDITYADDNDYFLKCTGNSNARGWGSSGSNGANCSFTAENQTMEGDIVYDSISSLNFYMVGSSTLTGAVIDDESNAGNGGDGTCVLYIDSSAEWTVTEDSTLTSLYNAGTIVDAEGKTVSIIGTDGTVYVEGDSDLTITVENYSTEVDLSGATQATEFADYEVENPFA